MSELRKPNDILNDLSQSRQILVDEMTIKISAALEKEFTGDAVNVWFDDYKTKFIAILPKLKEIFAAANWKIDITDSFDSQKDGASTCFRVSAVSK